MVDFKSLSFDARYHGSLLGIAAHLPNWFYFNLFYCIKAHGRSSNTPPNIYVRFLSARIQSMEDFRFLTSFCASSAKFCHARSHEGTCRKSKLQSQNGICLKFECGCSAVRHVQHSLPRRRLNFVTCSLKRDNLSPLNQIFHSTTSSSAYSTLILDGGTIHILTINH